MALNRLGDLLLDYYTSFTMLDRVAAVWILTIQAVLNVYFLNQTVSEDAISAFTRPEIYGMWSILDIIVIAPFILFVTPLLGAFFELLYGRIVQSAAKRFPGVFG